MRSSHKALFLSKLSNGLYRHSFALILYSVVGGVAVVAGATLFGMLTRLPLNHSPERNRLTRDYGLVYNPRTQANQFSPGPQLDAVDGVRFLQMQDKSLAGSAGTQLVKHFTKPGASVDEFFVIDPDTHRRTDFLSQQELAFWTRFNDHAAALMLLPPIFALGRLSRSILRARRTERAQPGLV